ncbi:multidrug resistance efflux transporter family protein [Moraxella osloensis]|uniref:Multidrug resistance efflux transporter family protein n=1 Tax=Faucicola osloensis TaxID=34062 RepID=A0A6P1KDF1_FAUOS|nr:multidrug resistance efflux transporter family protein [Moraxella osloensis]QHG09616.1 multidrug resistance efflux transporter family protein [Moraxella osloensis]
MGKMIVWGLIASAFFSTSFVLYQLMSVQGGHWFWSASFRCFFMWLLLSVFILLQNKLNPSKLLALGKLFASHWQFWCVTGGIGLGTYGLLAFAADYAEGWVIAATYLFTVVASLVVLSFFGQSFQKKVIVYSVIVFIGVVLANVGEGLRHSTSQGTDWHALLLFGALPAFIASFCFPLGNQLIWQAGQPKGGTTHSNNIMSNETRKLLKKVPQVTSPLLSNPLHKVWLMSLGSLPMWLVLGFMVQPTAPSVSQMTISFLVALMAGVLGTTTFLHARSLAKKPQQLAAVDATQGSEIIFALLGGMLLLHTPMPSGLSFVGIALVIIGLVLFAKQR